jgi:hypothetical protein
MNHSPEPRSLSFLDDADCGFVSKLVVVGGTSKPQLLAQLAEAGVQLNEAAQRLFASEEFVTSTARQTVTTVELAVRQLGFPHGATLREMRGKAITIGLCPPPLELGPHLRLQFLDQPEGHWGHGVTRHQAPPGSITIVSTPLSADDTFPKGFYLRRVQGVLWLRGYQCSAEHLWNPDDRLVFCRL